MSEEIRDNDGELKNWFQPNVLFIPQPWRPKLKMTIELSHSHTA